MRPRSSTNERRPDPPTFFIDRNLRGLFVARLRVAGLRVEELESHFPHNAPDVEWLPFVGARGWVVVTKDQLKSDPEEQVALMVHGVKAFVLIGHQVSHEALAALFLRKLRWIHRAVESHAEPFIAKLYAASGGHALITFSDLMNAQARRRR